MEKRKSEGNHVVSSRYLWGGLRILKGHRIGPRETGGECCLSGKNKLCIYFVSQLSCFRYSYICRYSLFKKFGSESSLKVTIVSF